MIVDGFRRFLLPPRQAPLLPDKVVAEIIQRQSALLQPQLRFLRGDQVALGTKLIRHFLNRISVRFQFAFGRVFFGRDPLLQSVPDWRQFAAVLRRVDHIGSQMASVPAREDGRICFSIWRQLSHRQIFGIR